MTDPRRPIHQVNEAGAGAFIMRRVNDHLVNVTTTATSELGVNGLTFVLMGTMSWIRELAEIEPKATGEWLRAMALLMDPTTSHAVKSEAERKRKAAVRKIFNTADLMMAKPEGNT